ncbi:MAG TPA: pyridoxamine 5'-phosphate oxidase family protein [Gaiellaceae bacterium]|nr:pyridoxamine 5'-phosphate oxidase family protein [Gaiellaceae bacterium]
MGKVFEQIDAKLADWIGRQRLFFVATAPTADGHVNVSPKGPIESLRIVDGLTVEYDDLVGSGAETAAHLRDDGRICVMLCAFEGPPRIVRLHGRGEIVPAEDPADGCRGVIRVRIDRISDSCGYGVPLMDYAGERPQREAWNARKGADGLRAYVAERNAVSIDGLPAFDGRVAEWTSNSPTSSA